MKKFWVIIAIILAMVLVCGVVVSLLGGLSGADEPSTSKKETEKEEEQGTTDTGTETEEEEAYILSGSWRITDTDATDLPGDDYFDWPDMQNDADGIEFETFFDNGSYNRIARSCSTNSGGLLLGCEDDFYFPSVGNRKQRR